MQAVQLIKKEVEVTKEASEVFSCVADLLKDIKSGKKIPELLAENVSGLMKAVEGFDQLDDEIKHKAFGITAGIGLGEIAGALLTPKAAQE